MSIERRIESVHRTKTSMGRSIQHSGEKHLANLAKVS